MKLSKPDARITSGTGLCHYDCRINAYALSLSMSRLHDSSDSSGNATSRTLRGGSSSSRISCMHEMTEIKTPHVAHIRFGAQDPKKALKIVRSSEQAVPSTGKLAYRAPNGHEQVLWIHLPANCRIWAEVRFLPVTKLYSDPLGNFCQHR